MALRAISLETSLEVLISVLSLVVVNYETRCQLRRIARQKRSIQSFCVKMITALVSLIALACQVNRFCSVFLPGNPSPTLLGGLARPWDLTERWKTLGVLRR